MTKRRKRKAGNQDPKKGLNTNKKRKMTKKPSTDNFIDDLFSAPPPKAKKKRIKPASTEPVDDQADFFTGKSNSGYRTTEEGYRIYTLDELNIGKGGDTPDCPFDCQCCF
eukprot:TRINITY_DN1704_c0_g1_i1.p2 TRINITY_DN1704_c0_g1~~TRINITY_DN1704_c0_g1_i1.p2  ORF type:complete len:110 (+),score=30.09 TRINITY_DN1704_c0_g1_i1:3-332(+)